MKVENVHTLFISNKTVKFYEYSELLKEIKNVEKVVMVKPDLVLMADKDTNVSFTKPRTCEIKRNGGLVRCETNTW